MHDFVSNLNVCLYHPISRNKGDIHNYPSVGGGGAFDKITYSFMAISQGLDKLIKIGEEGGL